MFQLSNLQFSGQPPWVDDLVLKPGESTVVLGRNFSGKSALCRLAAGLSSTATADVQLCGERLRSQADRMKQSALVFQAFVNYPNWTVFQNIASPLVASRLPSKDVDTKVRQVAELVKLELLLDRKPSELSGGQQQRLAIARALAKDPAVLVMDEPLVNIDYKLREELEAELRLLIRESQTCLLYATSNPRDALTLGDQVVLLDAHQVQQVGRPLEVYRQPLSFTAADLMSEPGINLLSERSALRPEHVSLDPSLDESVNGLILGVETNGADTFVRAEVNAGTLAAQWVVKLAGISTDLSPGEHRQFYFRHDDVLNFGSAPR